MISHQQMRDSLYIAVSGVAGTGVVHKYQRFAAQESKLRELYTSGGKLRGWYITRPARWRARGDFESRFDLADTWVLRGFLALADERESEIEFDTVLDSLQDALTADPTLGGLVEYTAVSSLEANIQEAGPVMFAGVLCHSAKIVFNIRYRQRIEG